MSLIAPLWRWLDGGSLHPKGQLAELPPTKSFPTRALKVIGAGPGRTGTASLKKALELLGFSPCYHMFECSRLGHADHWARALLQPGDVVSEFEHIFDVHGFQATVDFPASVAFLELLGRYPDAKVILTTRAPRSWARSVRETIWGPYSGDRSWVLAPWKGSFRRMSRAYQSRFLLDQQDANVESEEDLAVAFEKWEAHVKASVPPDRLLVFESHEGWEPLCAFLGVPVPEAPFPKVNESATMKEFLRARWWRYAVLDLCLCCAGAWVLRLLMTTLRSRRLEER